MTPATLNLLTVFDESRFISQVRARSKAGVLKELAAGLAKDPDIRHLDVLREALEAREKLGSTGIGKEVAIPHTRTLSVPKVKALVARSKSGVEWGAPDGKPVKIFFLVVAPPQERKSRYLPLLGGLVSAMQKKKGRDRVLGASSFQEVHAALEEALRA